MSHGLGEHRSRLSIAFGALCFLALILASPFLFTAQLARFVITRAFPENDPGIASATLYASGALDAHVIVLHDSASLSDHPLVTIGRLRAQFGWRDLFARRLHSVVLDDVVLYARSSARSQLSLFDFVLEHVPAAQASAAAPFWIDTVDVTGRIHREALIGLSTTAENDGHLIFKSTMAGERGNPARQIHLELGEVAGLRVPAAPHGGKSPGKNFGLLADASITPVAAGSRVTIEQLAVSNAAVTVDSAALRQLIPALPPEMVGRIDASLVSFSGAGEVDLASAGGGTLGGSLAFSKLHLHAPGGPNLSFVIDSLSGAAKVDSPLSFGPANSIKFERLEMHDSNVAIAAATLRRYLPSLPPEVAGRLELAVRDLTLDGSLAPRASPKLQHLEATLGFDGARIRIPGKSKTLLSIEDSAGAAKVAADLDAMPRGSINVARLQANNAASSVDLDTIRRYASKIPADLHGPVEASLEQFDLAGNAAPAPDGRLSFSGNLKLENFSAQTPGPGGNAVKLERMTTAATIDSLLERWTPASTVVRDGVAKIAGVSYGANSVANVDANWHDDGAILACDRCAFDIFGGSIVGAPAYDLRTNSMPSRAIEIHSIDVHQALSNLSPEHFDAEGRASGSLHLAVGADGQLSGDVDLSFDGPGLLKIGEIPEVKQKLLETVSMDLALLAMHDLQRYPFKSGSLHLESAGRNSLLKIKFLRRPKTAADAIAPHEEIINGQKVMVGSLVVPVIDMTIPITGQSLAEILALVSGVHPLIQTSTEPVHN